MKKKAVEVADASEVADAHEANEAAEVLRSVKSLLRTTESLNSAFFLGRIMKYVEF